jgi:hypothetical protein
MALKWIAILAIGLFAVPLYAQEPMALKTEKDKESHGIRVGTARNCKRQGMEVYLKMVAKGLRDELSGTKLLLSKVDLSAAMTDFQTEMKQKQEQSAESVHFDQLWKHSARDNVPGSPQTATLTGTGQ